MEVHLPPELRKRLDHLAAEQGRDAESLIGEAVERLVDYETWFLREVEAGLASAEGEEFVDHAEVGKLLDRRYSG
jgi:predicted transcriptional regulator